MHTSRHQISNTKAYFTKYRVKQKKGTHVLISTAKTIAPKEKLYLKSLKKKIQEWNQDIVCFFTSNMFRDMATNMKVFISLFLRFLRSQKITRGLFKYYVIKRVGGVGQMIMS